MAHIKRLSPELQKIAIVELGEAPSRIPDDLEALKTWIDQQPHLKARTDDQFLIQFLRGCHFNLEEAKLKVDTFFAFKTIFPDFVQANSPKFREIYNLGCAAVLPIPLNGCGPRIVVYRYNYPTDMYAIEEVIVVCNAISELFIINDPYAGVCGVVYIFDMVNVTIRHVLQYTLATVKKLVAFYEKSLPLRIRSLCFVNVPTVAEQLFKILLPCLSANLRQRVSICGRNMTKLTESIPLKYLPQDYGGENGSLDQLVEKYSPVWDEYREYFEQNEEYGTVESLRPGKPFDFDGLFT